MKIGPGVSELWGRKSPIPIDKAHGLYNSLYYRTSRDVNVNVFWSTFHSFIHSFYSLNLTDATHNMRNGQLEN